MGRTKKGIMKRFLLTITLTLGVFLGGFVGTAGASNVPSQLTTMYTTYKQIGTALASSTSTTASIKSLFVRYSGEAVVLAGEDHTRSKLINADIRAYAVAANNWAWVGYQTLASNTSNLGPWKSANNTLNAVIVKFTKDLKASK